MNKEKLIEKYEKMKANKKRLTSVDLVLKDLRSLDEPEPLPFKLKDVVGRIRGFDPTTQTIWLNIILNELDSDYGLMKYRSGYDQGLLDGACVGNQLKVADKTRQELNKPVIPQFVAEVIEGAKEESPELEDLFRYIWFNEIAEEFTEWYGKKSNRDLFVRAWLDGYEVEEEKRYRVKAKGTRQYLHKDTCGPRFSSMFMSDFTRNDIEDLDLGWVFSCEGIEVEEVE
jgi:hypothetical protein